MNINSSSNIISMQEALEELRQEIQDAELFGIV